MTDKRKLALVGAVVILAALPFVNLMIIDHMENNHDEMVPSMDAPPVCVPEEVDPINCLVKVTNQIHESRYYGHGIIMERDKEVFVLTSEMIVVDGVGTILVTFPSGEKVEAELIVTNPDLGLAALKVEGLTAGMPFDTAPNLPPDVETEACTLEGPGTATVKGYLKSNPNWMLLAGVDEDFVGAPLVNNGQVVGMVVGMNIANPEEAIAVGSQTLREFADQVVSMEANDANTP